MWQIQLLGGFKAISGNFVVSHFETRKAASLLAYLAYHRDRVYPREVLAEMLWPDEDLDATRDRLRQALAAIRRALETAGVDDGAVLVTDRSDVGLVTGRVITDVEQFICASKSAEKATDPQSALCLLQEAIEAYKGELLPGYYEPWVAGERDSLAEMHYDCLCRASSRLEADGRIHEAVQYARVAVNADALREEAHGALIRLYAAEGRIAAALKQYAELERVLHEELGVAPSSDVTALVSDIRARRSRPSDVATIEADSLSATSGLEPEGGAVPLDSPFYITRPTDSEFQQAIQRNDSIVLVKGARQIGKTSLLARGLQQSRERGAKVILTDIQKLTDSQLETAEALFYNLAESISDQLLLDIRIADTWQVGRGWNVNFERFMRRDVLGKADGPIIWGLDEVDRLFAHSYSKSVFGLFRAWHNERSLDPSGPWSRLTLAIAYATEAHLFISDLNQSPFNVGTRLALQDFTRGEVTELNRRYGSVLHGEKELKKFVDLVGGHPYLVRKGLHVLTESANDLEPFLARATREDGVFGDHLSRMYESLSQDAVLCEAMREILRGKPCPTPESFYRLQSAGLISGASDLDARPRCRLYREYLARRLL
jgi:DNA-binding SARP family transcriptional activator